MRRTVFVNSTHTRAHTQTNKTTREMQNGHKVEVEGETAEEMKRKKTALMMK